MAHRARHDRRDLRARRRRVGRRPTTSGSSATTARSSCSTPPTTTSRSSRRSTAAGCGRSCSPTATTTTSTPRCRCATPSTRRSCCTPPTACCGTSCGPASRPTATLSPARRSRSAATSWRVLHTPGHSPGCCCFHDAGAGAVFSGDTLFCGGPGATGRSFSDEPTILRSIRDTAARPARRHRRAHRPRRVDDHRRRATRRPRPGRRTRRLNGFRARPVTHLCNRSPESSSTTRGATRRSSRTCSATEPTGGRAPNCGSAPTRTARPRSHDGTPAARRSPATLPYLLKVLAAAEPLSLQAHPTTDQAVDGHRRGVYPDANAKPELLCALTQFEALCGVRPVDATLAFLEELGARRARVGDLAATASGAALERCTAAESIRADRRRVRDERSSRSVVGAPVCTSTYPGDASVVATLLLNYVVLEAGRGDPPHRRQPPRLPRTAPASS